MVQLLVFFMVFLKFIKLAALTDQLSHPWTHIIQYNLASFLVTVLKLISTNQFTIKDSFTFVDWAKSRKHNHETMCSFDVCSLFTNVPLDETIQICLTKLYSLPDPPTTNSPQRFAWVRDEEKPLHIRWTILWPDRWRRDEVPLGLVLANIFMCHFEERWLTNNQFRPFGLDTSMTLSPYLTVKTPLPDF